MAGARASERLGHWEQARTGGQAKEGWLDGPPVPTPTMAPRTTSVTVSALELPVVMFKLAM